MEQVCNTNNKVGTYKKECMRIFVDRINMQNGVNNNTNK